MKQAKNQNADTKIIKAMYGTLFLLAYISTILTVMMFWTDNLTVIEFILTLAVFSLTAYASATVVKRAKTIEAARERHRLIYYKEERY